MYTFIICWFVGGLTTFHLYLISTNQTTYENFRYQYDQKMNPYNLGCSRNCAEVFLSMIPSSKNDFRAKAEDDSSFDFCTPLYSTRVIKPQMVKKSFDPEMVKRKSLDADDFEDTLGSLGRLERCSTEPRRSSSWEHKIDWGLSPDNI